MSPRIQKTFLKTAVALGVAALSSQSANAQLLITQYYEGASFDKWIELSNVGNTTLNLSSYSLGLWANANTEAYKANGTPNSSITLSGSLAAGASLLIQNSGAALPTYALGTGITNNGVINFNGDDSVTLFTGGTFATANVVDAVGFTDLGNEGANLSFIRLSDGVGWNTTAGSTVLNFGSVWQSVTTASVDAATAGTEIRLGFTTVTVVPEPSAIGMILLGGAALLAGTRKRV